MEAKKVQPTVQKRSCLRQKLHPYVSVSSCQHQKNVRLLHWLTTKLHLTTYPVSKKIIKKKSVQVRHLQKEYENVSTYMLFICTASQFLEVEGFWKKTASTVLVPLVTNTNSAATFTWYEWYFLRLQICLDLFASTSTVQYYFPLHLTKTRPRLFPAATFLLFDFERQSWPVTICQQFSSSSWHPLE